MNRLEHALKWTQQRRLERRPPAGKIYMIRDGQYVKIGITSNVKERLMSMQVGSPRKLRLLDSWQSIDPRKEERQIHRLLRPYHVRGEWFKLPSSLLRVLLKRT